MLTAADTAYMVASLRAAEATLPPAARLFVDPYAALFEAAGAHAAEATNRFLDLPFVRDAVRLRTRFIDDFLREGLTAGIGQIVLLGAGFDTRALRMTEIAERGAKVFEVDLADQLAKKRAILAGGGIAPPAWDAFVACDFAAPDFETVLPDELESHGFHRGAGALFVLEGVIPYIDDAAIDRTLRVVVHVGGRGSRLVFEFAHERFDPERIDARLRRLGFARFDEVGFDALWRRDLSGEPHPAASIVRMGVATV